MSKRELLQDLIQNFAPSNLNRFLSAANPDFKPIQEDLSHCLDTDGYFSDFRKTGHIEFKDGRRLLVATIRSDKEITERTSKKKQYDLGKKVLKGQLYDSGLFLFHNTQGTFRLSFINAQYMGPKRGFTPFRRYTYFVTPEFSNKTFLNQVSRCSFSSIEDILEAFSIEAVSGAFYNEFKPHFDKIAAAVKGQLDIANALKEDFALLFAIRIIFLGFVQKKGWLGDNPRFIQDFWEEYKRQFEGCNEFYEKWLTPLFFQALNSPPGQKVQWNNNDFSQKTESILQMAPYLNGELFKKKKGVDDQGLWLPDKVIGEYVDWLFQYNFTIEENELYDEELELNPEFLGIIFERLVNKADGAVYTPRTEVDLMCRLALLNWLDKNSKADQRELYYQFFREGGGGAQFDGDQKEGNFSANEIRQLVELLESVTVCDPAAGSGAFEVGMMHVINETLDSLYNNPKCPDDVPRKDPFQRKKAIIGRSLYGVEVKRWAVWINQLRLWLTLFIDMPNDMRNSFTPLLPSLNFKIRRGDSLVQRIGGKLFPVHGHADVPPAIKKKITELKKAKLDFFYNKGMEEEMVRQMEYQAFQTVIQSQIAEKQKALAAVEPPKKQMGLGFAAEEAEQGHFLKLEQFEKKRQTLKEEIEELKAELQNLQEEHPLIWSIEFSEIFYEKGGFDIIIGNPPYVRQEDITDPDGGFEPRTYKDLLQQTMRLDYPKYFTEKRKIDGKSDLYTYFYLRSLHLLNEKGVHVFICSNSWLDVGYGTWMQEFLLNLVPVRWIIDNQARRSFATSDINTIISIMDAPLPKGTVPDDHLVKFIAFKKPFEDCIFTENLLELEQATEIIKNEVFRVFPVTNKSLYEEGWGKESQKYVGDKWGGKYLRAPDIFFTILQKGKGKLVKLKDVAEVHRGITTGCNEFFYLNKKQAKEWNIEKKYLKVAVLRTDELSKPSIEEKNIEGYFFWCSEDKRNLNNTNALRYIQWGERQTIVIKQGKNKGKTITGFNNIETVKNRRRWYDITGRVPAPIWWIIAHNERAVAFCNSICIPGDNFFEIYPSRIDSDSLYLQLCSTISCFYRELFGRVSFGGGLLKTQKPDLLIFNILEKIKANINTREHDLFLHRDALSIFEECGLNPKSEIPLSEQEPKPLPDRKELDDIVFDALGLTAEERKEVYRAVCQLVWNRISKAKSVKKRK